MKSLFLVSTALLSVISANRVIHLTADNFDAVVDGTRNVFVKFEASWCGPCKRIAPIMDKVAAESFPNLDGETVLAAIDADAEREIGDRFEIDAFPTIKLFLKGRNPEDAVEFQDERTPEKITQFINTHVAMNFESLPTEYKELKPEMPLTKLLQEFAKVGPRPKVLKNGVINTNFATGFMDDDSDSDGYYKKASRPSKHTQKNLKQKKNKNKKDMTRSKKEATDAYAALPLVDTATAQATIQSARSKPVILIFFSYQCPHCSEFLPLAAKYAETRPDTIFLRINGDANIAYRDSFKLRYYPSIIGFYANSNGNRYELMASDRGIDHFNSFISKLIKH